MRHLDFVILYSFFFNLYAQPNTEIYLFDLDGKDGKIELTNLRNISNNEGYDNQPSFYDNKTILFSSTRKGQTDIARYDIPSGKVSWITETPGGSEYSPLRIPDSDDISAIRLDTTGLQRLYRYDASTGKSEELLKDLKVGYHVWYNDHIIVSSVLVEDQMDLVVTNLKDNTNYKMQKNVGRSLHKIPNSDLISYISKEKTDRGLWSLKSLNPISGASDVILNVYEKFEDTAWMSDGSVLFPAITKITKYKPEVERRIRVAHEFNQKEVYNISRIAVSPDGRHIAIVSEESPAKIVQKQVDSYNAGDLDAFIGCYAKDVVVRNFPSDTLYVGHKKMRENYSGLSPENKIYEVEVAKRIVIGNKVIDHGKVDKNGGFQQMQVALYEVNNGKISSMTFIFDDDTASDPETIVQKQLDAYNDRDIEGFLATYTEDVELYNFPLEKRSTGLHRMREDYAGFFESTPDLHCEIKNRIIIGNKVIDEEFITANGSNFNAVAIYEVKKGKIGKVTFLR